MALQLLFHMEWRGVEHQQDFRAGIARLRGRAGLPDVGADVDAEAHAALFEDHRLLAPGEGAQFVENRVVGQFLLSVGGDDASVAQYRSRVVTLLAFRQGMPHHHRQPGRQSRSQRLQHAGVLAVEIGAQRQIFRGIAAQGQFRREHEGGAACGGLPRHVENLGGIAVEVADGGVELGDGEFHGAHSTGQAGNVHPPSKGRHFGQAGRSGA